MKIRLVLILSAVIFAQATLAETVACPDLATAVQVGTCPSEEELQFTFNGYCSDNARIYEKPEDQLCTDYAIYRSMKNFSLWETRDGRFSGYVSCDPGKAGLEGAKVSGLKLDKQGSVARLTCHYSTGAVFTHRTKSKCVADAGHCASDPAACQASCE